MDVSVVLGILGLVGVVAFALNWRRDDTGKIVTQQDTLMGKMGALNDDLESALERTRGERDEARRDLEHAIGELRAAQEENRRMELLLLQAGLR